MAHPYYSRFSEPISFITTTIVDWVDIFTRECYCDIVIESLQHCIEHKGLCICSWVLMTNHIHMLCYAERADVPLWAILRDFKRYTSRQLYDAIDGNQAESRLWMTDHFRHPGGINLWQDGYDEFAVYELSTLIQKTNYIHNNPVKAGFVDRPEHYRYSSAVDFAGRKGLLPLVDVNYGVKTY
ncbi:MAG: transposase [Muribaculaceae bacterium]|nr:transposase [Muribaculaceae bacterium]